jgi:acyl-CoA thioesterase-1
MITAALIAAGLAACAPGERAPAARETAASDATSEPGAAPGPGPRVVFVGTSLTAGLGLEDPALAYPGLLQRELDEAGLAYTVVNAGVSGETSAGALARLDWLMTDPVAVLVVETGANDGLRGLEAGELRHNLQAIVDRARQQQPRPAVVLLGMRTLTNYGADYGQRFAAVYREVAEANQLPLVPFLLEGVGGVAALNQADGIHPTPEGQRLMAATVWEVLEPVLRERALATPPAAEAAP